MSAAGCRARGREEVRRVSAATPRPASPPARSQWHYAGSVEQRTRIVNCRRRAWRITSGRAGSEAAAPRAVQTPRKSKRLLKGCFWPRSDLHSTDASRPRLCENSLPKLPTLNSTSQIALYSTIGPSGIPNRPPKTRGFRVFTQPRPIAVLGVGGKRPFLSTPKADVRAYACVSRAAPRIIFVSTRNAFASSSSATADTSTR